MADNVHMAFFVALAALLSCVAVGLSIANGGKSGYCEAMKFRVLIEPDEDGVFVADCPVLPGCVSQGKTREEAVANIRDAIQGYLHSLEKHNEPIPAPVVEEIVEVPI